MMTVSRSLGARSCEAGGYPVLALELDGYIRQT